MTFPKTFLLCTAGLVGLVLASAIAELPSGIQVEFASVSQTGDGYSLKPEGSKLLLTFGALNAMASEAAANEEVVATSAPAVAKPQSLVAGELEFKEDSEQIEFLIPTASKVTVRHFELQSPNRVVIDVSGSVYSVSKQSVKINSDLIRKIRFGYGDTEQGKLVRCVFDLSRKATYSVIPAEGGVLIRFQKGSGVGAALKKVVHFDSVSTLNLQRNEGDNQGGIRVPAKVATPAAVATPEASQPMAVATPSVNNQLLPFRVGEKLSYRISWSNIVEAGTAELSVTAEEGKPNSLRLQAKAITAAAVAGSYPFKDDFVSHFDTLTCSPWLYEKNFTERKRVVRDRVTFNQAQRTALYTNSRNQSKQIPIELGTQDPVSSLYAIRSLRLTPGMQVTFPVLDGGIQYLLEARVVGSELITIKTGSFNAHRLDVNLRRESGAVTNRSITAWISADARSLPVLVSVALPVGAAVIELAGVTP
jgi:uncharacterized protein DUF3108/AMIN domain-containing protein